MGTRGVNGDVGDNGDIAAKAFATTLRATFGAGVRLYLPGSSLFEWVEARL